MLMFYNFFTSHIPQRAQDCFRNMFAITDPSFINRQHWAISLTPFQTPPPLQNKFWNFRYFYNFKNVIK